MPDSAGAMLALALAAGACAALAGGCTVGDGTGAASGPIWLLGCTPDSDFGIDGTPRIFDLDPRFFAGEPIEDIAVALPANRLLIRIQRNGNRIEVNDTLYIDVQNAYEVARCVRGRTKDGVPQYLTDTTTSYLTGLRTTTPWCDWSGAPAAADGGNADAGGAADAGPNVGATHPRIHFGTEEIVRSSLSLLFTCHKANVVGLAFDGWIEFQDFGGAAQPNVPPEDRGELTQKTFKINFGDRLHARFHITLGDQRVIQAIKDMRPMPASLIGGELDGFFDFDLERGRAAQPFP